MKFQLLFLCLIICSTRISFNLAKLTVGTYADPSHPGQCAVMGMNLLPHAIVRHPDICAKISCHEKSTASIVECPPMVPPKDCSLGEPVDPKANYPSCCRVRIICKNGIKFNS